MSHLTDPTSSTSSPISSVADYSDSSSLPFQTPVDTNLFIFQQKLDTLMKTATPGDPALKAALDTYAALLQAATLERMTASLPNMSEAAIVETNGQITTLLRIVERTNARYSREKRDQEAQERRLIRDSRSAFTVETVVKDRLSLSIHVMPSSLLIAELKSVDAIKKCYRRHGAPNHLRLNAFRR